MTTIIDTDALTPAEKDEWASLLHAQAVRDRRTLPDEQAWGAWQDAPLTPGWLGSQLADVGRVRVAVRQLLVLDGWRPHQITEAMTAVALHVCPEAGIAEMAVAAGIADAMEILGDCVPGSGDEPW